MRWRRGQADLKSMKLGLGCFAGMVGICQVKISSCHWGLIVQAKGDYIKTMAIPVDFERQYVQQD